LARGRFSQHVRSNLVGYLALFVALGGTAWATNGPLQGRNTVGSADILNGEVKAPDIGNNAVSAPEIKNASSGSDAVDADLLDGFDSDDFAPAADVHVADRVKIDDPTAGDAAGATTPLFTSGSVSLLGECFDNFSIGNDDVATVRVLVTGTGNASLSLIQTNDPPFVANLATFGGGTELVSNGQPNASGTSRVRSAYFILVAPDGQVVSGSVSAEINDNDGGSTSDCAFAATAVG
jgi:hypothetical protein